MEIIVNGEIYVKNGPHAFYMSDKDNKEMADLEFNSLSNDASNIEEWYLDKLKSLKDVEGKPDYSGCEDFWISYVNEDGINMVQMDPMAHITHIKPLVRTYKNINEVKKDFTRLTDFLNDAEYIGKYFKRTASRKENGDCGYMSGELKTLCIYKKGNMMLVKTDHLGSERFEMLKPYYLDDGNYEFFGGYDSTPVDKKELYQLIFKQLVDKKREKSL